MERRTGETAAEYLERIPEFAVKKSDRNTVRGFLNRLGNPDKGMKIFHVAGTNGKGSVCSFLSSVLKEAGISHGMFTSPHLTDIRERFMINGAMVSEGLFSEAFEAIYREVEGWIREGNPHPTYFEFLFYMGMWMFSESRIKLLVLETGMGGLKDVTNVIEEPLVSVITSISVDHTAFLGKTIPEIASHKAGIIKAGCPVVYDAASKPAAAVIKAQAEKMGSKAYAVGPIPYRAGEESLNINVTYQGEQTAFEVPFSAPYQSVNAALAIKALEVSGLLLDAKTVQRGIRSMHWPARMEQILPGVYLDGAHNEDGIRAFLTAACLLKERKNPKETRILFSVASDKDYKSMLQEIGERLEPEVCILTGMDNHRVLPMAELYEAAGAAFKTGTRIQCCQTVKEALVPFLEGHEENTLSFIVGSLYLAGEIREWMESRKEEPDRREEKK